MLEMSVSELLQALNPFKAQVQKNVCNDEIGYLAGLLVRKRYEYHMKVYR